MLKTERLVAIMLLLQARGKMTAERLADILDVSVRTIYRDMDALSLAHVPVSMDYGPGGGYYLPDDYRLDPATFTGEEAVALALGGSMAGDGRLFQNGDGLRRALFKLEAALPDEYRGDIRKAQERILFDSSAWYRRPSSAPFLEPVRTALWGARQLDILYPRSDGPGTTWRRVEPYGLVCKAAVWYLVAYCHLRRNFRIFRVSRIEELAIREDTTTPRPDFDLQSFWEDARRRFEEQTGELSLTLRVEPRLVSRAAAEGTILREEEDGGAVVRMEVESAEAAISYALSLGAGAVVIEPEEIRGAVAKEAQALVGAYG